MHIEDEISRRKFLAMSGAVAAAGTFGPLLDPLSALGATSWPKGRLGAGDAIRVKDSQFMPVGQFLQWNQALDRLGPSNQKGLRATGSPAHEGYIDGLHNLLQKAGVQHLQFESVPMQRWTADTWSLDILDGAGAGPVKTSSYIPYSGQTPAQGVTAPLVFVPAGTTPAAGSLAGKIAVAEITFQVLPLSFYLALGYPGHVYDPHGELSPSRKYKRSYLTDVGAVFHKVEKAGAAGAAGVIVVLDYPFEGTRGSYFPYDGVVRKTPGLFVDRTSGTALQAQAQAGARARLTLPATTKHVSTRNLIGFIPGQSSELVGLTSHTDGCNGLEENGPGAVVAMSQYLARLPKRSLPRTIMILLTAGHFAGGNGARAFRKHHANDLVKRTNAAVTLEHLGAHEWDEIRPGQMGPTGHYEPGAIFCPGSKALVDAGFAALRSAQASPSGIDKPLNPAADGVTTAVWPGEGQYLFARGGIADANYITGPSYLLQWGVTTVDKINHQRMRNQAIAFTEMILRLGRTSRNDLITYTL